MITLLGSLLGFFGSALPHFFSLLRDRVDHKHELELLRLQLEALEKQGSMKIDDNLISSSFSDVDSARKLAAREPKGYKLMEAYSASIRPTLALALFLLYAWAKYSGIAPVWTDEDQILVATMFAFYFGNRIFDKFKK